MGRVPVFNAGPAEGSVFRNVMTGMLGGGHSVM